MVQLRCRLLSITTFALLFLTLYNIFLTLRLMYSAECIHQRDEKVPQPQLHQDPNIMEIKLASDRDERQHKGVAKEEQVPIQQPPCSGHFMEQSDEQATFASLDLRLGRWDNGLSFKLFDNIALGDRFSELSEEYAVCLATQSSLEKLKSIVDVSNQWSGPISAALYAAGDDELNLLLLYVLYLRTCYPQIRNKVNWHLVLPRARLATILDVDVTAVQQMDCKRPDVVLQQLLKRRTVNTSKWRNKFPYPQNHLRNVARKNCQSGYVFLTDVDIVPSSNLAEHLNTFLRSSVCQGQCAYVIPTYELDTRVRFPANKTELVRLANNGLARPFHHKVFIYNQFATNFSRWQQSTEEPVDVHISHPVTNFEFLYEPFYVAPDTVPPHDERFVGYGYTRNTQVYEMFVAGYEFQVLSPIFTCHWGLQVKRTRPPWREHQNNENRKRFETFKKEVFARYNKDPLHMAVPQQQQPLGTGRRT